MPTWSAGIICLLADGERHGNFEDRSPSCSGTEKIEALITLIDEDLGYHLHQAVQRVKFELSHADVAQFNSATAA